MNGHAIKPEDKQSTLSRLVIFQKLYGYILRILLILFIKVKKKKPLIFVINLCFSFTLELQFNLRKYVVAVFIV